MTKNALSIVMACAALCACDGFVGETTPPEGQRLIVGALEVPDPGVVTLRDQVALQIAALHIDTSTPSTPIGAIYVGPSFNPSSNGGQPVTFRLAIPTTEAVTLIVQTPSGSGSGLGRLVSRVVFAKNGQGEDADVLAAAGQDLELGVLKITASTASQQGGDNPGSDERRVRLGDGESQNPLSINDSDGDGVPDLEDADDDNDLIPDEGDEDANGDGILDAFQTLDALPDIDGDRIPDALEP